MPLRVLFLNWRDFSHPETGGAEKYLVEIAQGLAERGHHVTFRTAAYPGALHEETVNGVHYIRRGGRLSIYPVALLAQLIRRDRADVVVDVQNGVPYLTPLVRRGPVINLVHHIHREQWETLFPGHLARAGWWLESTVAPLVYRRRRYVAVSGSTRRELGGLGVDPERIAIVHNGTDLTSDEPVGRTPHPSVIVLGRLVPQKRIEIAIDAAAHLREVFPSLTLTIAGSGWWEPHLREYVTSRGLDDLVQFAGHVSEDEKHRLLASHWLNLLPSRKEGWGLVIVEAASHSTPTVAFSEAGGPTDAIIHDETGLLTDTGTDAFARAIRDLLRDDDRRERLGARARERANGFTWSSAVDSWERILTEAAAGQGQL
jgi:glycosyltransferase involved in cell wall biosynthesis